MKFAIVEIRRTSSRSFFFPACSKEYSSSNDRSKWSSSVFLSHFVTRMMSVIPAATISLTIYCMIGLSTIGSISFGCALVAGRNRVPLPATAMIALLILPAFVFLSMVLGRFFRACDKVSFDVGARRFDEALFDIPQHFKDHECQHCHISGNDVETVTARGADRSNHPKSRGGGEAGELVALDKNNTGAKKTDADDDLRRDAQRIKDRRVGVLK